VIVMPAGAPPAKLAATRGYGAEVVTYDRFTEDREAISRKLAQERGMTLIPPFDHADVIAGQGTAAKELFDEAARPRRCRRAARSMAWSPPPATTAGNRCARASA
jgi:threonine dehydratase